MFLPQLMTQGLDRRSPASPAMPLIHHQVEFHSATADVTGRGGRAGPCVKDVSDKLGMSATSPNVSRMVSSVSLEVEDQFVGDEEQDEQRLEVEQDLFEDEEKRYQNSCQRNFPGSLVRLAFFDRAVEGSR